MALAASLPTQLQEIRSRLPPLLQFKVQSARELAAATSERMERAGQAGDALLSTSLPALDRLLAGGLPRGQMVELWGGGGSSGRFSVILAALSAATRGGETAALIDLGDHLDPAAAQRAGAVLDQLLWVRPHNVQQALGSAEILIDTGFPLVVVELGLPPLAGGRRTEGAWLRLARAAQARGTALLISSPYRVSGTAAQAVVRTGRVRAAWQGGGAAPDLLTHCSSRLELEKHRQGSPRAQGQGERVDFSVSPFPFAPDLEAPAEEKSPLRFAAASA
jgi:recA bacterial DNA recombination protein